MTDNDGDRAVGNSIRTMREALGLSQAELANAMRDRGHDNFFPQTIAKLEGGRRTLQFVEGIALAEVLGVAPEDLSGLDVNTYSDDADARRESRVFIDHATKARTAFLHLKTSDSKLRWHLENGSLSGGVQGLLRSYLSTQGAEVMAAQFAEHAKTPPDEWWAGWEKGRD